MDQLRVYHTGGWLSPKLLAEAKSDENERTKTESSGSNTPWAYRPGELSFGLHPGPPSPLAPLSTVHRPNILSVLCTVPSL